MVVFGLENVSGGIDEVERYQLGRYISSNEATWRIFSFDIHERHPTVVHLICKYICKYITKGSDMVVFGLENVSGGIDEVERYQLGRYISSNEATWRIFSFDIHERHPTVVHLAVDLENGQRVYFTAENLQERARTPPQTTLTAFFSLCATDSFARTLLYSEVPKYYTWNAAMKSFQRRKQGRPLEGYVD